MGHAQSPTLRGLSLSTVTAELIDKNPYTVFRPKVGHCKPRNPLTADELMLLRHAALPAALARVRDLFIFSAYTGLAYSDAVTVTPDDIVERDGLTKTLTTHVARRTFATTVALANGVPIESLSRMLGHKDIHTAQIYATVLAQTVVDDGAKLAGKIR